MGLFSSLTSSIRTAVSGKLGSKGSFRTNIATTLLRSKGKSKIQTRTNTSVSLGKGKTKININLGT